MAVTFDATSKGIISGATSLTISHTVGSGSNRALYVFAICLNSTDYLAAGTCSFNGTDMGAAVASDTRSSNAMYVWRMLAPTTTTANVVITPSASAFVHAYCISLSDVDQGAPNGTIVKTTNQFFSSPLSQSITVDSGGMAIDMVSLRTDAVTLTQAGSQTLNGSGQAGGVSSSNSSRLADATAMGWSWAVGVSDVVAIAVPVKPSGGGGGSGIDPQLKFRSTLQAAGRASIF